ncbi:MAG: hypothetical protein ACRBFS_19385 [Aureispira sp.]
MEDKDVIKERISTWFSANRRGKKADKPCYWTLYPASSPNIKIPSGANKTSSNFDVEELKESVELVIFDMSSNVHTKYYAIRLRESSTDPGFMTFYENPFKKSNQSSLAGLPNHKNQGEQNFMMQWVMTQAEISRQESISLQAQIAESNANMRDLLQEKKDEIAQMKTEARIGNLKSEIAAIQAANNTKFSQFMEEVMPMAKEFVMYKMMPPSEQPEQQNKQDDSKGQQQQDSNNSELDKALNDLGKSVNSHQDVIYLRTLYIATTWATEEEKKELQQALLPFFERAKMRNEEHKKNTQQQ